MLYLFALLPILVVLGLMILARWSGQRAGLAGLLAGVLIAALAFGLTPQVLWISQLKGVLLALYVLIIIWPALLLFNVVNQIGGIQAIAQGLERAMGDRGVLLIVMAWAFSGALEGVAGFGLPIAVVAPMLVGLGVEPVTAVAAVAVGHAWSVTMGDMGVIFQTLVAVSNMDGTLLAPASALMLGVACLACGWVSARILGQGRRWPLVVALAALMSVTQYALAVMGLVPLAALGAGLVGVFCGILLGRQGDKVTLAGGQSDKVTPLWIALSGYVALVVLMTAIALVRPLHTALYPVVWQMNFPEIKTLTGFVTPAGAGQAFRVLVHPGTSILLIACLTYLLYRRLGLIASGGWRPSVAAMWRSAAPASVGILAMVGLAMLMDHCGMTLLLARGLSAAMGRAFPLVSPLVGCLGAFATGSNNNSNVLFASLQKNAAIFLAMDPRILLAAQTTGGALGSMMAPAKVIVGCSTAGIKGRDGDVLRVTVPYGLVIALAIGVLTLMWTIR